MTSKEGDIYIERCLLRDLMRVMRDERLRVMRDERLRVMRNALRYEM